MRFFRKNASLAPRRSGFDSRRLHSRPGLGGTTQQSEAAREKDIVSNAMHDRTAGDTLAMTWEANPDEFTIAAFTEIVLAQGLEHVAVTTWATERMTLEGLLDRAVRSLRDGVERAAVLELDDDLGEGCVVHISLRRGRARLWSAGHTVDVLAAAKAWMQERYPVSTPDERQEVEVSFWDSESMWRTSRTIRVPAWTEIAENYPASVSHELASLLGRRFDDEHAGKLVLWHGAPGTGKTHALRAFAWEWRRWCRFHYITDPEQFVGNPKYMLEVLLDRDDDDDDSGWRLLILEDTGELLALDAKRQTGQGLSRLLNVVDGLIGQGLRVLVLVTTNETLRSMHAAVSRPGRCVAQVEFTAFPPAEADAWLERRGLTGDGSARTLASLYGNPDGAEGEGRHPLGFTA
jgi:ATPase family associated with various cellular activities (AAA)